MIPDYLLSPKAGEGITIFVIDTGLNPFHPDFMNSYDPDDYYAVPNALMGLPKKMPSPINSELVDYIPDSDRIMSESRDHGSYVASLAAGKVYGVAKKAHLVPVKYKNRWAVLNFSQGFSHLTGDAWEERRRVMDKLLRLCWKNDIVTVIAAGNDGERVNFDLSKDVPGCLGARDNPLITVGASTLEGNRWIGATRETGSGGSITTSAQGDDQVRCVDAGVGGSQLRRGTSLVAHQVAGLVVYFMSLSQSELPDALNTDAATTGRFAAAGVSDGFFIGPDLHIKGTVSQAVKDYIGRMTFKRNPASPDAVSIAYNGAEEGLCQMVPNNSFKRKRGGIIPRAGEGDLVPVVVSGVLDPTASYPLPACPLSSPASSATSSSSFTSTSPSAASTALPQTTVTPPSSTDLASPSVPETTTLQHVTPTSISTTSLTSIPVAAPAVTPPQPALPALNPTATSSTTSKQCKPGPVVNGMAAPMICF
ncbi:hypothetical protein IFR05_000654 [Cadophora sp. M221]|nr:hypothetical protein IFR05_000654 [Cadophora sp. M221]